MYLAGDVRRGGRQSEAWLSDKASGHTELLIPRESLALRVEVAAATPARRTLAAEVRRMAAGIDVRQGLAKSEGSHRPEAMEARPAGYDRWMAHEAPGYGPNRLHSEVHGGQEGQGHEKTTAAGQGGKGTAGECNRRAREADGCQAV